MERQELATQAASPSDGKVGWWQFWGKCAGDAFKGGWLVAEIVGVVITIAGGFVAWRWPHLGGDVNFLMWAVPLAVIFVIVYFGSLFAAYNFYEARLAELEQRLGLRGHAAGQRREEVVLKLASCDDASKEVLRFLLRLNGMNEQQIDEHMRQKGYGRESWRTEWGNGVSNNTGFLTRDHQGKQWIKDEVRGVLEELL